MIQRLNYLLAVLILLSLNIYAQINTERYRLDSDSIGFTGFADIDITAITGNTDFQFINLGGRLNYNWGTSYTFLVADGGFGWDDGERIFDQALLHLRHVQKLSNLIQTEVFFQTDFNKKRLLSERELIGAGLRFRILKLDYFKFRLGTSYFFEHEKYDVAVNSYHGNNLFANRLSTYLTFEFEIKDDLKLVMINYLQPQIGKWDDYRIISDNYLAIELSSLVNVNVCFNLRYDSRPPETIKNTDTVTKFGLSFKF
jgi:hypothetical protein